MPYWENVLIYTSILAILTVSINLVAGYTGLISLAHAGFYGIGAYVFSILVVHHHVGFIASTVAALFVAGVCAGVIGWISSRFRGDYYVLGTMGMSVIIWSVFLNWNAVTRGPLGIPWIPRPVIFGVAFNTLAMYLLFCLLILVLVILVAWLIVHSPFGRVLKAIREDEEALEIFGYRVLWFKLVIFVIASMMAALAGVLYASYVRFVDPSAFTLIESVYIISFAILGGLANFKGSILAAILFYALFEGVRFLGFSPEIAAQVRVAIVGLLLIVLMMFRPQGVLGEYKL